VMLGSMADTSSGMLGQFVLLLDLEREGSLE